MADLAITYTDGRTVECALADWPRLRADGIDEVRITARRGYTALSGHSVYWLYREGDDWIAGSGSVGGNLPTELTELIVRPDGTHDARRIEYMPDLPHEVVKLGWWR